MKKVLLLLLAAGAVAAVALLRGPAPQASQASSHREAPLISDDPTADNTDLYAFRSPDKPDSVTIIANWIPGEDPAAGPNYYTFSPGARYYIYIDKNGDAQPDITYRFEFKRAAGQFFLGNTQQDFTVTRIAGGQEQVVATGTTPPDNIGPKSTPNYRTLAAKSIASLIVVFNPSASQEDQSYVTTIGDEATRDYQLLQSLYQQYKATPSATTEAAIENTLTLIVQNLPQILNAGHVKDPSLQGKLSSAVNILITIADAIVSQMPVKSPTLRSRKNRSLRRSLACASAIGAALRGAGFSPSLYHADPIPGENKPFADRRNGVHYYDNLIVLKTARTPAVLLEAGVIVNRDEELKVQSEEVRRRIAAAVADGLQRCL